MQRFFVVCLAFTCGVVLTTEAAAQSRFPVSSEMSVGFRVGHGGTYVSRGGAALDLLLSARLREISAGTLIGGLALEVQTPVTSELECRMIDPGGACAPEFPTFLSGAVIFGAQRGSARTPSARIAAGPAYYRDFEGGGALGLHGRMDVATPTWLHIAAIASLRGAVLPSFRGEALGITSFGLGFRIQ